MKVFRNPMHNNILSTIFKKNKRYKHDKFQDAKQIISTSWQDCLGVMYNLNSTMFLSELRLKASLILTLVHNKCGDLFQSVRDFLLFSLEYLSTAYII